MALLIKSFTLCLVFYSHRL